MLFYTAAHWSPGMCGGGLWAKETMNQEVCDASARPCMHVLLTLTHNRRTRQRFATMTYFVVEVTKTHPTQPHNPSDVPHTESYRFRLARASLWPENRKSWVVVKKVCLHTASTMNTDPDGCFPPDYVPCDQKFCDPSQFSSGQCFHSRRCYNNIGILGQPAYHH